MYSSVRPAAWAWAISACSSAPVWPIPNRHSDAAGREAPPCGRAHPPLLRHVLLTFALRGPTRRSTADSLHTALPPRSCAQSAQTVGIPDDRTSGLGQQVARERPRPARGGPWWGADDSVT